MVTRILHDMTSLRASFTFIQQLGCAPAAYGQIIDWVTVRSSHTGEQRAVDISLESSLDPC